MLRRDVKIRLSYHNFPHWTVHELTIKHIYLDFSSTEAWPQDGKVSTMQQSDFVQHCLTKQLMAITS